MITRVFLIGWVLFIAQLIGFADDSKPDEKEWDNPRGYKIMKPDNLDSEKNYPLLSLCMDLPLMVQGSRLSSL